MDHADTAQSISIKSYLDPGSLKQIPRRRQLMILAAVGGGLVVALFGIPAISSLFEAKQAPAPSQVSDGSFLPTQQQWAGLKFETVNMKSFRPIAATDGRIALDDDVTTPVFSPYSGRVTRLLAKAGDVVKVGTPLFAVEATELAQAQNDLIAAAGALRAAKAQLDLAQTNERRQHELYDAGGAALKDWQQSKVDLANAQSGASAAEIALAAVRSRMRILGKADDEIAALENGKNLVETRAETIVRSPIAGTITQRQVGPGQNIVSAASGGTATPLFSIGDVSKVWLIANLREGDAPLIHLGDPVEVSVMALPGRSFPARITYVAAAIDPNTHRLTVRAEVDNADGLLKPEMLASFEISMGKETASPAVPDRAVVFEGARAHVWIANSDKKSLTLREIEVGRDQHGYIEATSGLKAGEQVVTSGAVFFDRAIDAD